LKRQGAGRINARFLPMSEPDPKETLREFREYFASVYEARYKLAARIGISNLTLAGLLPASRQLMAKTLAKLRAFLDAEAKRNRAANGIKHIEPVAIKIVKPQRYSQPCFELVLIDKI
jgi:hypothetical protein